MHGKQFIDGAVAGRGDAQPLTAAQDAAGFELDSTFSYFKIGFERGAHAVAVDVALGTDFNAKDDVVLGVVLFQLVRQEVEGLPRGPAPAVDPNPFLSHHVILS